MTGLKFGYIFVKKLKQHYNVYVIVRPKIENFDNWQSPCCYFTYHMYAVSGI